jgi:hypothetical protein
MLKFPMSFHLYQKEELKMIKNIARINRYNNIKATHRLGSTGLATKINRNIKKT